MFTAVLFLNKRLVHKSITIRMHGFQISTLLITRYIQDAEKRTVLLKLNTLFILRCAILRLLWDVQQVTEISFCCLLCLRTLPSYLILSVAVNCMTRRVVIFSFLSYSDFFYTLIVIVVVTDTPRHIHRHMHTLGRTPLNSGSARLYLTTHNAYKRQTSISPAGFEPAIPASERPQTYTLELTATGIGPNPLIRILCVLQ